MHCLSFGTNRILDSVELYEQQRPFTLQQLTLLAALVNQLLFRAVLGQYVSVIPVPCAADGAGAAAASGPAAAADCSPRCAPVDYFSQLSDALRALHVLLIVLYERDSRRRFTPGLERGGGRGSSSSAVGYSAVWLARELKTNAFLHEVERRRPEALFLLRNIPHILPHREVPHTLVTFSIVSLPFFCLQSFWLRVRVNDFIIRVDRFGTTICSLYVFLLKY